VRWEPSPCLNSSQQHDAAAEDLRTMVCYKDSHSTRKLDPNPHEWTGVWRDGRDINPLGAHPENALTGQVTTYILH
jgi:hypothetical protein